MPILSVLKELNDCKVVCYVKWKWCNSDMIPAKDLDWVFFPTYYFKIKPL